MKLRGPSIFFIKQIIFWVIFYAFARSVFILLNANDIYGAELWEVVKSYGYGLYLDLSVISYIHLLSFLLLLPFIWFQSKWSYVLNKCLMACLLFVNAIIIVAEIPLYKEWGIKIHYKALKYLQNPAEVLSTASFNELVFGSIAILGISLGFIYFYNRWLSYSKSTWKGGKWPQKTLVTLLFPVIGIIGVRGGVQEIPIQQSDAYYSKHHILNISAVNSLWNLGQSIDQNKAYMNKNPYVYMDHETAIKKVADLYKVSKDTTIELLTTVRPNVVFIILESWSADLMKPLGGFDSITPFMNEISTQGVLFEDMYASGARSDQGMGAIYSAFPAQPTTSIISQSSKYARLPMMTNYFKKEGYTTSFLFGGDLSYGNIKSYMMYQDFDLIEEESDLPAKYPRGSLGIHDEFALEHFHKTLNTLPTPFFSNIFTVSTHSPFDMPMGEQVIHFGGKEQAYLNSAYYTDQCLKTFFEKVKDEDWYDNTLFVVMADHSHNSPRNWGFFNPPYRRIPMLFYGNVIKNEYRGYRHPGIYSQVDLAATLFSQLQFDASVFKWSKNALNQNVKQFAYYGFVDGVGYVSPKGHIVYDHAINRYHEEKYVDLKDSTEVRNNGKALLQSVFEEYLAY